MSRVAKLLSSLRRLPLRTFPVDASASCFPGVFSSGQSLSFSTVRPTFDLKFTKRHEWISVTSGGKDERVGLTEYCQEELGDIVFVQLPEVAAKVKKHDECGAVESVKAASEIHAPLDGTVTSVNQEVTNSPGLINSEPYGKGWMFTMTIDEIKDLDRLMNQDEYNAFLAAEKPLF